MSEYQNILSQLNPISLEEMDAVKLMERRDKKYITHLDNLPALLRDALSDYQVLEINGIREMGYESLYFDTDDHEMFIKHHNRKMNRYKIRIRQYTRSKEFFLEVKFKSNREQTKKTRIPVASYDSLLSPEGRSFVENISGYNPSLLSPKLYTTFNRITLVNQQLNERVTIDTGLNLQYENKNFHLPFLVVLEVKSMRSGDSGGFKSILLDHRIFKRKMSKYCVGTTLLYPKLKTNRFKAKILYINKLEKTYYHDQLLSSPV